MGKRYFTSELFGFFEGLSANNDRTWFKANQSAYERFVREPALDFIGDFAKPLHSISEHFVADPRKLGGSLYRIQRDTRFGTDKTPYKTNTGMHFRHTAAKDAHAPGFYLHVQPGECFIGAGLWRPEPSVAIGVRTRIDEDQAGWAKATRAKRFTDVFSLEGDSLSRPPKGFDPTHPFIDDLKRKDFIAICRIEESLVTSDRLMDEFVDRCKRAKPLMGLLCAGVGVPF